MFWGDTTWESIRTYLSSLSCQGEDIDIYLGVTLGISTMCAAAIGNIVSDLCGVVFSTVIVLRLTRLPYACF